MRKSNLLRSSGLTALGICAVLGVMAGCDALGGGVGLLPFGQITSVQIFDQPNYTVALSAETAVLNPQAVTKVNWVFGDGTGFVTGPADRATIQYRYSATGTYQVTAFIFDQNGLAAQVNGTVKVVPNDNDPPAPSDLPGAITGANPGNDATEVNVRTLLTWTGVAAAASYDVYLGTNETEVENATTATAALYRGNQTATRYDPEPDLAADTEYFWRVDTRNAAGVAKGVVYSFKTAKAPKPAKDFIPADAAANVPVAQVLRWTAGLRATSHDVYFGKDEAAVTNATKDTEDIFIGNQTGATYDPADEDADLDGQLLPATTYYWRIDEVGPGGTVKGPTLRFTTRAAPPQITNPLPPPNSIDVNVDQNLSWSAASSVTSFDVYFGDDEIALAAAVRGSPAFKGNQTAKSYDPGTLDSATDYYWRIDTLGAGGTTKGQVFRFTTASAPGRVVAPFVPADNATDILVTTNLQWTAGFGGVLHYYAVYLSTNQNDVINGSSAAFKGFENPGDTEYDPPTDLAPSTWHYWRVDAVGPGGTTVGPVLRFYTGPLPQQARNPSPANGQANVAIQPTLTWTAGVGAVSHDVYFGASQSAVNNATRASAEFKGNQPGTSFNPGVLSGVTTYYWRIDEVLNNGSATKGLVWQFSTAAGKATAPSPANFATNVETDGHLSWTGGAGAVAYNVYFSNVLADVESDAALVATNLALTAYQPATMMADTTYYWRIDCVAADLTTVTRGDIWRFTTKGLPDQVSGPSPFNGATNVEITASLSWSVAAKATTYRIYLSTVEADVIAGAAAAFQGEQSGTSFNPTPDLLNNTLYYWRIDAVNSAGVTEGVVWSFRTKP